MQTESQFKTLMLPFFFCFQAEGLYTPASIVTWSSAATDRIEGWKLNDEGACS